MRPLSPGPCPAGHVYDAETKACVADVNKETRQVIATVEKIPMHDRIRRLGPQGLAVLYGLLGEAEGKKLVGG